MLQVIELVRVTPAIRRAGIYAAEVRKNRRSGGNFPATILLPLHIFMLYYLLCYDFSFLLLILMKLL